MSNLAILGGSPVRTKPYEKRVSMGPEEKKAAMRVLDSDVLSGFVGAPGKYFNGGTEVLEIERLWREAYGFKHAISTNSWTTGLQVAVGAIGIEPGDEVICPPYTMSASATAALFYGGIPIFADIDPNRYSIDPKSIESLITPRTKAIVVVHLFGCPADMDPIVEISKRYNLRIIEDAAQAPGVIYKGRPVGAIGDIGGFSLNFHKHIHTGEGGILVTNDDALAIRSQLIRNHGENVVESLGITELANTIGSNYRFTELQAAIAIAQFAKLKGIIKHREKLAKYLDNRISSLDGLSHTSIEADSTHAYYMYPIKFDPNVFGVTRNQFLRAVMAELPTPTTWDTTPLAEGYIKPLYLAPLYQKKIAIGKKGFPFNCNPGVDYNYAEGACPITESLYRNELLLTPLIREGLEINDISDFADAIEKVIENISELRKHFVAEIDDKMFDAIQAIEEYQKN